jgi:Xaa-Pro aminopeptidase
MEKKIEFFRKLMDRQGVGVFVLTGQDPWCSEYVSERWQTRKLLTGFTGSAGTVLVTPDQAGLWTDFRYFIQADKELAGTGVDLYRQDTPGIPDWEHWLLEYCQPGTSVGIDPRTISFSRFEKLRKTLNKRDMELVSDRMSELTDSLVSTEVLSPGRIWYPDSDTCGEEAIIKIEKLRKWIQSVGLSGYYLNSLDDQCWLLNIRGSDVPYNQVAEGSLLVTPEGGCYYTSKDRIECGIEIRLKELGLDCRDQSAIEENILSHFECNHSLPEIGYDSDRTNWGIVSVLSRHCVMIPQDSPIQDWKSIKNTIEILNTEKSLVKDTFTLFRFEEELRKKLSSGELLTEDQAAGMLNDERMKQSGFLCESFATIAAAGENSAVCHYHAAPGLGRVIHPDDLFLLDSGSHYLTGTTDLTRTFTFLDNPPSLQVEDYTLVLKSHIALAGTRFPKGTRGYQLDALARVPLWKKGRQYGHGTGHGIGFLLTVHEGPQSISPRPLDKAIEPGMVVSCEPGIYREGQYGIRLENVLVCEVDGNTEFGQFLRFRVLSFYPFEENLVDAGMLTPEEKQWLAGYYKHMLAEPQDRDWAIWVGKKWSKMENILFPG